MFVTGLVGLIVTTGTPTAVRPTRAGLLLLAGWLLLFAMTGWVTRSEGTTAAGSFLGRMTRSRLWIVFLLVGIGLLGAQALMRSRLPMSHDSHHHLWGFWAIWRTILDGDLSPAWIPYLGLGMPLLEFYSPLSFILGLPAQLLGFSAAGTYRWVMMLTQVSTAISMFSAARWMGAQRLASLLAAAAVVLAPYHLLDLTNRGAMAECTAFAVAPWVLASAWKVLTSEDRRAVWAFAISTSTLLLAHSLVLIACLYALSILSILGWFGSRESIRLRLRRLVKLGLAGALAMCWTCSWWLPITFDLQHVGLADDSPGAEEFADYSNSITEPWSRRGWASFQARLPWSGGDRPDQAYPYYFGWGLSALAALGFIRTRSSGVDRLGSFLWTASCAVLLISTMRPIPLWIGLIPGVSSLELPSRLLLPATIAAAFAGALSLGRSQGPTPAPRVQALVATLFACLIVYDAIEYLGAPDLHPALPSRGMVHVHDRQAIPVSVPRSTFIRIEEAPFPPSDYDFHVGMTRMVLAVFQPRQLWHSYSSRWIFEPQERALSESLNVSLRFSPYQSTPIQLEAQPYATLIPRPGTALPIAWARPLEWRRKPETIFVELPKNHPGGLVSIAEMAYPGWRVSTDGGDFSPLTLSRPTLAAEVDASVELIVFDYDHLGPWYRKLGLAITVLSLMACVPRASRRIWPGRRFEP